MSPCLAQPLAFFAAAVFFLFERFASARQYQLSHRLALASGWRRSGPRRRLSGQLGSLQAYGTRRAISRQTENKTSAVTNGWLVAHERARSDRLTLAVIGPAYPRSHRNLHRMSVQSCPHVGRISTIRCVHVRSAVAAICWTPERFPRPPPNEAYLPMGKAESHATAAVRFAMAVASLLQARAAVSGAPNDEWQALYRTACRLPLPYLSPHIREKQWKIRR